MSIKRSFQIFALLLGCATLHAQVATEAWARRYSYDSGSLDRGRAVATDGAGNVIVAGLTDDGAPSSQWLIIKYNGAGLPVWTNRYNDPANLSDTTAAVAVNASGTIFVTGSSFSVSNYSDSLTIAYSAAGVPLWTNRYDGPDHRGDYGYAVAVGANGNVFVASTSAVNASGSQYTDYLTIAYSEAGVPLWTNRYNGPRNYSDNPAAIAVSPGGTVFVTGTSDTGTFNGTYENYATIAYSGAGAPLWTNIYNGPDNKYDHANALAVGTNGDVFVTGVSSSDSGYDYATVAYTEAGVPLWTNRYDGPVNGWDYAYSVAVSTDGSVYVTGFSETGTNLYDLATIAYSGSGVPLWTNSCGGMANLPSAVAVSTDGTVFVTGSTLNFISNRFDYATLAYSSGGVPLWTNRYDGPGNTNDQPAAITVSPSGNVFVTGSSHNGSSDDCATIAYTGSGLPLWTNRFDGVANKTDQLTAVAVGPDGTVFISGGSLGISNRHDYATIAYSSVGVPLWTNRFYSIAYTFETAPALAVGPDGTLYIAGLRSASGFGTLAISSAGVPLWTNYNSGSGSIGSVSGVAVSPNGTVFVSGYYTIKPGRVYSTLAISSAGASLGTIPAGDTCLGVDGSGNVLLTGWGLTRAYSEAGVLLWTNRFNGLTDASLAVAPNGNVIVTGSISNDFGTVACSSAGVSLWTNRYDGPGNSNDAAVAVAVSPNGNVIVTGSSRNAGNFYDYATIAYSGAGVPLWTNRYGELGVDSMAQAVVVNSNGTVFVTGSSSGSNGSGDFVTVVYSEAGVPLSTNRYNGPANGNDVVPRYSLALASDGVVVAGSSALYTSPTAAARDYAVVKYTFTSNPNPPGTNGLPSPVITQLPGGDVQLTFYGTSGLSYVLEHAFDLGSNSWAPVQTNTAAVNGAIPFTYLPLGPINFWRIRPLP